MNNLIEWSMYMIISHTIIIAVMIQLATLSITFALANKLSAKPAEATSNRSGNTR
jgi:hypothetical protein